MGRSPRVLIRREGDDDGGGGHLPAIRAEGRRLADEVEDVAEVVSAPLQTPTHFLRCCRARCAHAGRCRRRARARARAILPLHYATTTPFACC